MTLATADLAHCYRQLWLNPAQYSYQAGRKLRPASRAAAIRGPLSVAIEARTECPKTKKLVIETARFAAAETCAIPENIEGFDTARTRLVTADYCSAFHAVLQGRREADSGFFVWSRYADSGGQLRQIATVVRPERVVELLAPNKHP